MKGFKNYNEFEKAYDLHYPEMALFADAQTKGFKTADDFFDALQKGFSSPYEFTEAKEKMIATKKEYDDFCYLKAALVNNMSHDQWQILEILRNAINGKKLKTAELLKLMETEQEKYKRSFNMSDTKVLPLWYSRKIADLGKLDEFLQTNATIKKQGTYDNKNKTFEIFRLNRTKVYIDASNVAHNTSVTHGKQPFFKNIRLMVEELMVWKFTDITVIADASLRHKAKDDEEMKRIDKLCDYHESPSHTQADKFLLDLIHKEKCIIISNDTFSDWQQKDFWVKKNIEKLRFPFMITGDKVSLPGIEKLAKENEG